MWGPRGVKTNSPRQEAALFVLMTSVAISRDLVRSFTESKQCSHDPTFPSFSTGTMEVGCGFSGFSMSPAEPLGVVPRREPPRGVLNPLPPSLSLCSWLWWPPITAPHLYLVKWSITNGLSLVTFNNYQVENSSTTIHNRQLTLTWQWQLTSWRQTSEGCSSEIWYCIQAQLHGRAPLPVHLVNYQYIYW